MEKLIEALKDELLRSLQSYKDNAERCSPWQKERQAYLSGKIDALNCAILMMGLEADRERKGKA